MKTVFITATGTEVGKTLVACALAWRLRTRGETVKVLKPVISGFDPDDAESDARRILDCLGERPNIAAVDAISPWRFAAPISPDMAAKREARTIDFDALVGFCRNAAQGDGTLLIEGIGGAFVPLTLRHLVADWITALDARTIVVTGSYLGTLSHTIATVQALRHRGIRVASLIVSESENSPVGLDETVEAFRHWLGGARVYGLERQPAGPAPWETAPDLTAAL
jgi:dethiobiotin synthetase